MITQEEKEQLKEAAELMKIVTEAASSLPEPTEEEKEQINELATSVAVINKALENTATAPVQAKMGKPLADISRLVPSGNLNKLKERIAGRMPISDEEYNKLVGAMKADIRTNSRLNGLLKNVSLVAETLVTKVLPLFLV